MLQNAYFLAKIGADTAEIVPIGRRVADRCPGGRAARGRVAQVRQPSPLRTAPIPGDGARPLGLQSENGKIGKISKLFLQNFAIFFRLVLSCIKTKLSDQTLIGIRHLNL